MNQSMGVTHEIVTIVLLFKTLCRLGDYVPHSDHAQDLFGYQRAVNRGGSHPGS